MKAKNQLQAMATNVVTAMNNYRLAAYENLKELGTTISVRSDEDYDPNTGEELDDEDQPNKGVYVYAPGKYYSLTECKVDAVKAGDKQIECHISEENEDGQDCWCTLDYFYEEGQMYILDNIIWPDSVPDEGEADKHQDGEKRVRVLCFCDTTDNTKGVLLVTHSGGSLWDKRQDIDKAIRCAFYDQYEAEGVHPADEDEDEFEQVLDKLAAGYNADLYEYEIFWESTDMV